LQLVAFDRFGNTVRTWNLPGSHGEAAGEFICPTVGDFNNDGLTEIAVQYGLNASSGAPPSTMLSVFATGAAVRPGANDWPMLNHDSRNTSVLRRVAGSAVSLSVPTTPVIAGQPAAFVLAVAPVSPATGNPTGTANLLDGSNNIGSCKLSSGACTVTVSLTPGTQSLVAGYVGDKHFASNLSQSVSVYASASVPDFSVSGTSIAIVAGAATGNTSTITVTPSGAFTGSVALSAAITSSPAGAVDPPTFSFGSTTPVSISTTASGSATLTVSTTAAYSSCSATLLRPKSAPWYTTGGAALACLLLFGVSARRKRWQTAIGMLALLAAFAGGVLACGGSSISNCNTVSHSGTTAGAYVITVTGTSGTTTSASAVTLSVQ
jgi:hypothetical protein